MRSLYERRKMAKIVFVQTELRDRYGPLCLYSYLKKHNHESDVFCDNAEDDIVTSILDAEPDIIGFSSMTTEFKSHLSIANEIKKKKKNIPILFGGPHPTFYPEIINEESIDVICMNEGEDAVLELMNVIDEFSDDLAQARDIKNLWIKEGDNIHKNSIRDLQENLDLVSPLDRDIYYNRYEILKVNPTRTIYIGRGCPFGCAYCFNHSLKKMVEGKGKFIRMRSNDNVFDEIRYLKENYGLKWVQFNDDTFNLQREWMVNFLKAYEKEIKIPFICNVRVDFLDEELIKRLKVAGCDRANFGVEHGSYAVRKKLLKRNITDDHLIGAGKLFKKYKIRVNTTNIIGLPDETIDDAMKTIEINRAVQPEFSAFSLLQPFPKTEIYDYVSKHGYLCDDFCFDQLSTFTQEFKSDRPLSQIKNDSIKELGNIQALSHYLIHFPFLTTIIIDVLIKLPFTRLYQRAYLLPYYLIKLKFEDSLKRKIDLIKHIFL